MASCMPSGRISSGSMTIGLSTRCRNDLVRAFCGSPMTRLGEALLDDEAAVHEDDPVGGLTGEGHLVRHDHHRHAFGGQPLHDGEHLTDQLRVQGRGRLVEQHELGVHGQRPGDRDALLLPAGQLGRERVLPVGHADPGEVLARRLGGLGPGPTENLRLGDRQVAQHGEMREEVEALEDHPDPPAGGVDVDVGVGHLVVADDDPTGRRGLEHVDAPQQRRLARPRRADHAHDLAGVDLQADVLEHLVVAERLGQVLDGDRVARRRFDRWAAHGSILPSRSGARASARGWTAAGSARGSTTRRR